MRFSKIIHYNRHENSFTARVFESYLFPLWNNDFSAFDNFVEMLMLRSKANHDYLSDKFGETGITYFEPDDKYTFVDGMLFLENMDIYGYCENHDDKKKLDLSEDKVDKTEFDCVIVAKDKKGNEIALVFEVKCFSNLEKEEIIRQNKLFKEYQGAGLFSRFHHFALISCENLENGRIFADKCFGKLINFYFITWDDFFKYINQHMNDSNFSRFIPEIEFKKLHKTITKKGEYKTERKLIK